MSSMPHFRNRAISPRAAGLQPWRATWICSAIPSTRPAAEHGATSEHVSLLQGAKAYGLHVGRTPLPAKERSPRDHHENFYFLQEDASAAAEGASWSWTVFRPQVVFGESFASPMNLVPVIGVYAVLERERVGRCRSRAVRRRDRKRSTLAARPRTAWAADVPPLGARSSTSRTATCSAGTMCGRLSRLPSPWRSVSLAAAARGHDAGTRPRVGRVGGPVPICDPHATGSFVGGSWADADTLFGSLGRDRELPALLSTVKIRQWVPRLHRHRGHALRLAGKVAGAPAPPLLTDPPS